MEHSESIAKLAAALAAFQSEVKDPARDGENPHFRSKYVQIDGLLAAVRPILAKHGLSVIQSTGGNGQDISVTTEIMHTSGEWVRTDALMIKPAKADPQGCMSAITYSRRYSLSAALGVAWDDDDDGNAASAPKPTPKAEDKPTPKAEDKPAPKAKTPTKDDYLREVAAEAKKQHLGGKEVQYILRTRYQKSASSELTLEEASDLAANFIQYAVTYINEMGMSEDDNKLMEGV